MAKKVREETISLVSYLNRVNNEDISTNQDVQRMFCWDNAAINELIVTVLTDDYIPPLILGEIELSEELVQHYIVDGMQRTTALNKFRYMNWKTTSSFENSIIKYQIKQRDEYGNIIKDSMGNIQWDTFEFDIRNKTYNQLPDELKRKFDDYQISLVIHQNCTMSEISKLIRRYNRNKSMSVNQKAFTFLPTYARRVKNITQNNLFYKNCIVPSDAMRKNGTYEQTIANSVMATFHMSDWRSSPQSLNEYLEDYSCDEEFDMIEKYSKRIENVCSDKYQDIFTFKDIPVWFAVFNRFDKYNLPDEKFRTFLDVLRGDLGKKEINGVSYEMIVQDKHPKDKKVILQKYKIYISLLDIFLNTSSEVIQAFEKEDNTLEIDSLTFVQKYINPDANKEDIECYEEMLQDYIKVDTQLYKKCKTALIALIGYSCSLEKDVEFGEWINTYKSESFSNNQYLNYVLLKDSFNRFLRKDEVA